MNDGDSLTELFSMQLSAAPSSVVVARARPFDAGSIPVCDPYDDRRKLLMMLDAVRA
jgi:hypothetical protein